MDTQASAQDRLLICHMPTGLAYCDRAREEHGDYKRIANLFWIDLSFVPSKNVSGEILKLAREHAKTFQERKGDKVQVSSSGQTVTPGWGI